MKKIDTAILPILDSVLIEGNVVRLTQQLDRPTYMAVNKILEAIGGKWNRKAKGHIFETDPADVIEEVILTQEYSNKKQDFGFFETPPELAKEVVRLADIRPGMSVLEPSAGQGALVRALGEEIHEKSPMTAIDILDENVEALIAAGFIDSGKGDFLGFHPNLGENVLGFFDRVIMNPPFAKQADIDHVTHAMKFLKPGGRLVAIMSAGVKFRENEKAKIFRKLIERMNGQIIDNPDGSFKASGTMVNTVIVVLNN